MQAEVLASSNDQGIAAHTALAELTLAHVRCELECGRDVVVLVDSITRLVRAFNLHGAGGGRFRPAASTPAQLNPSALLWAGP